MVKALDPQDPDYAEMLNRFESEMAVEDSRDTDDLFTKFKFWQGKYPTDNQKTLLRKYAKEHDIPEAIEYRPRPMGISRRKGVPREQLKRRFTVHKVRGKTKMVARIPKGMKGAGRFAKRP